MKKILIVLGIVLINIPFFSQAATFETLTVGAGTAVGFTSARLTERPVYSAFCTIETNDVRVLYGTTTSPTSSVGLYFPKNTSFRIDNQRHMETFKVISVSGTATVSVLYEP